MDSGEQSYVCSTRQESQRESPPMKRESGSGQQSKGTLPIFNENKSKE